jgi:hypothetical protein
MLIRFNICLSAEEEQKCVDATGRLLFRKPKEKSDESDTGTATSSSNNNNKVDIIDMASNKTIKRKQTTNKHEEEKNTSEMKRAKTQLLSFMDEEDIDGDD